jgi:hypothetical protein
MLVVVPGHLIFIYTIRYFKEGEASPTNIFIAFYLTAALVQVRKVGYFLSFKKCPVSQMEVIVITLNVNFNVSESDRTWKRF